MIHHNVRALATTVVAVSAIVLTGCSMQSLPTYDEIRGETQNAMQRIVDELPSESRVEDLTTGTPFTCGDGKRVFFTGHWAVYPPDGFDNVTFVDGLPETLGADFTRIEGAIDKGPGSVKLGTTDASDVRLDATVVDVVGTSAIDILATSRCGQGPSDPGT